jgi:hypothetical protein
MKFQFTMLNVVFEETSGRERDLLEQKYAEVSATDFPVTFRRLADTLSRLLMGTAPASEIIFSEAEGRAGRTSVSGGVGTRVDAWAKIIPGSSYAGYLKNLNSGKYMWDISNETWCILCPAQCKVQSPQVDLFTCPAIKGNITLSSIKAWPMSQAQWDARYNSNPWYTTWWGILLLALLVVYCCGALVMGYMMKNRRSKGKRSVDTRVFDSGMSSQYSQESEAMVEDPLDQELLHPDEPDGREIGGIHDVGDSRLPFPEAGLPNAQQMPFPEAGFGHEHTWANQQVAMHARADFRR